MENIFDHYDLLEVMEGTEKRPENDPEKSPWVRKSAQGYVLLGQALGSSQIRHIKPFQREPEKGPKAWAALKGVHAPATVAVAVVLERQMAALRIEEDEAVEEGVQKFFNLFTRLEGADFNYRELQKKTKLLALLPESWSSLIINLNRDLPRLSLEDVKRAILQEDFRHRELASADGAGAASIDRGYGCGRGRGRGGGRFGGSNFNGGRGSSGYGNDNKNNGRGRGRFDSECHFCHKSGHMWRDCYKLPDGWTPAQGQDGRGAGGGRGRGRGGRGGRGGGAASMKSAGNESESRDDRFPGQFFFVSTQALAGPEKDEGFEEPATVGKVTLHSLDYWVIDSGATYSMTPRTDLLTELELSPVKHVTSTLGQRAEVKGMGKAMFKGADGKMVGLKNIPVVPMPKERQVAATISTKAEAVGSGDGANGRAKEIESKKCNLGGTSKLVEHKESGAAAQKQHKGAENPKAAAEEEYRENMWGTIASAAFSNPTSATGECDWLILHRRMGHVAMPILQQLVKNEMVAGIRVKGEPDEHHITLGCPTCMQAKFTRYPFSSSEATAKAPLDEVVMDVVGPLKLGAAGAEYFLTIVDVYTRMTWVYVLSKKSDVAETVNTDWLPMVERQQDRLVKAIRTDRGGEFLNKEFSLWLKKNGIRHSLTMPYSPAMNGIAEPANRTITETARGLLIEAGLPDYFWPDAVRSACVAKNRALNHVGADKWVPYVGWIGRKPKVDMLRVFGCMSMALVPKHLRHNKLGAKAIWAVHLGMAQNSKGWILWDPFIKKLLVSRDCKFMENLMYKDWKAENEAKIGMRFGEVKSSGLEHVELPLELSSGSTTTRQSSLVNGGEEAKDAEDEEEEVQQMSERAPTLPSRTTSAQRIRVTPQQRQGLHSDYEECAFAFFSSVEMPGEPATLKEALESSDAEEWKKAMESELKSIEENGTWELVELLEGRKAITSKWLFKIKSDADGKIERYKSRLVAKGYQQKEKVDYKELFAPVVKPTTLRSLLAGAAIKGWEVKQMDVTTAFLNGVLEEEIFMAQPEGFDDGSGRVLRLKKALYGLKQAPRQWYLKLRGVLEEIGFTPSSADHSLFMHGEGEQRSFMVVYADDILIFSPSSDLVKEVMLKLQDKFKCKALGDVSFYLELHIKRDVEKRCMRVHQRKYLEALAANFGQSEGHVATPFPSGFKCVKGPEEESVGEEERRRFHTLVGSLMYAAVNTRPDVAFTTGQLARVVQCPNEEQVAGGMRVAKYLGQTPTVGLQYSAAAQRRQKGADGVEPGRLFLTAFSDASFASELEDMTSVGGFIYCVGGGPTSWESKKQVDQALSSVESEYMALFRAVREIVWQRRLLAELGEEQQGPTPLDCDNQGSIALAKNPVFHGLTKHMRFTPRGQRVTHCTCSRTGRHLATFTRRPGSSLYTLTSASPPVAASGQVATSGQVFFAASRSSPVCAPCSCRPLSHETLLWHHRLGHPSLPRLRGMASRTLVSDLPRSLPPLPPGPAPTCVPCVEGRQCAAPQSSEFPPTEAPLQTLHMDVWGPARIHGQGHERYFLLVVDDYSRYNTKMILVHHSLRPRIVRANLRSLAHYHCRVNLRMVRPAAAIVTMFDPVANAGVADTLEARLSDARKRHADGEYRSIPLLIVELGIRSQWATEHPSRPVSPRPVRNEGGIDDEVDGGARVSGNNGTKQRGVIKADGGVDRSQARVQQSTAGARSSRANVDGRRHSPQRSGGRLSSLDEDSITSYILQDEAMQEAEQPTELLPQANYAAPMKLNQQKGQLGKPGGGGSGGGRSTRRGRRGTRAEEVVVDGGSAGSATTPTTRRPCQDAKQRKEKQTSRKTSSTKDVDNSSGKSQGDGEASCSMVGVVEPTVSLAPEVGEDFQAVAAVVQPNPMAVLLDSGCSHHLIGTKAVFIDMAPSDGVKHVRGFNGALQPVEGRRTDALQGEARKRVLIPDVLYVLGVQANLLFAGLLKESGVQLKGDGNEMLLVAATGGVLGRTRYTG
ncbi:unnamed protein product [Closterium sp. NIES-54]